MGGTWLRNGPWSSWEAIVHSTALLPELIVVLIHTSDPADEKLLMWFGDWVTANRVKLWHFSFQSRDCCYFQSADKGIESLLDHNAEQNIMHCSKMPLSVVQFYFTKKLLAVQHLSKIQKTWLGKIQILRSGSLSVDECESPSSILNLSCHLASCWRLWDKLEHSGKFKCSSMTH